VHVERHGEWRGVAQRDAIAQAPVDDPLAHERHGRVGLAGMCRREARVEERAVPTRRHGGEVDRWPPVDAQLEAVEEAGVAVVVALVAAGDDVPVRARHHERVAADAEHLAQRPAFGHVASGEVVMRISREVVAPSCAASR